MACSSVTGVTHDAVAQTIIEGESLTITGSFQTDGAGDACQQTLNWVAEKLTGNPVSFDTEQPASEDTDYAKVWTPSAGVYDVYVQCVWGPLGWPDSSNITNGDSVRITVRAKRDAVAEGEPGAAAAGGSSTAATAEGSSGAATAGGRANAANAEGEPLT